MEQPADSHELFLDEQLRPESPRCPATRYSRRNLGLVTGTRSGKSIVYSLYDDHVAMLLDQAVYHIENLRLGIPDAPTPRAAW